MDEEELDYSQEEYSDEISDIDDTDLLKRLDEKYGKISGRNSEENDWTSKYIVVLLDFKFDSVFLKLYVVLC